MSKGFHIVNEAGDKIADILQDGAIMRIAVDAKIASPGSGLVDIGKAWSIVFTELIISSMGSEFDYILLINPTTPSGTDPVKIEILDFLYSTTSQTTVLRMYRNPTITDVGTIIIPVNMLVGAGNSIIEVYTAPTISDRGILIRNEFTNLKAQPQIATNLARRIQPGETILITSEPSNNNKHYTTIIIGEENV